MSTHYLFVCESVHTVYYTVQSVAQSFTSVPPNSARMVTWQISILLTLVPSLVLLDPVLGDDQAPHLSVYPPVPGLEPSPYYGLRVREVSWATCLGTDFVDVVTSRLAKKVGKIFSLSWPSARQRNSATPPGCLTTSSIWTILVLFICLLNKEPQMENSGTGATLMWTSKLSMAPELNSRWLNLL